MARLRCYFHVPQNPQICEFCAAEVTYGPLPDRNPQQATAPVVPQQHTDGFLSTLAYVADPQQIAAAQQQARQVASFWDPANDFGTPAVETHPMREAVGDYPQLQPTSQAVQNATSSPDRNKAPGPRQNLPVTPGPPKWIPIFPALPHYFPGLEGRHIEGLPPLRQRSESPEPEDEDEDHEVMNQYPSPVASAAAAGPMWQGTPGMVGTLAEEARLQNIAFLAPQMPAAVAPRPATARPGPATPKKRKSIRTPSGPRKSVRTRKSKQPQAQDEDDEEEEEEVVKKQNQKKKKGEKSPEYAVDQVLDRRIHDGREEFLLSWVGSPASANSWEGYDNLNKYCEAEVADLRARNVDASKR